MSIPHKGIWGSNPHFSASRMLQARETVLVLFLSQRSWGIRTDEVNAVKEGQPIRLPFFSLHAMQKKSPHSRAFLYSDFVSLGCDEVKSLVEDDSVEVLSEDSVPSVEAVVSDDVSLDSVVVLSLELLLEGSIPSRLTS